MRTEIAKLHNRIGTTTIYVTHDQTEAMTMADRIVVLKDGIVQQVDSPQQMYDHPDNVFVAGFIGSPAMNFIRARLEKENGGYAVTFGKTRMPLSPRGRWQRPRREGQTSGSTSARGRARASARSTWRMPRPRRREALWRSPRAQNSVDVEPQVIESMGSEKYVYFELPREQAVHLAEHRAR